MTPPSPILLKTVFSVLLATDLVGNTMVLLVLPKNKCVSPAMKYLIANLAVADMMVGLFFAPEFFLMPMSAHPTGTAGDILCKLITGKNIAWVASLGSVFTIVLVAIERFYAIVYPLSIRRKITKGKVTVLVLCCWILATLLTLPSFLAERFVKKTHSCDERLPHRWQNVLYSIVWVAAAGFIPVVTMIVLYSRVFYSLWFKDNGFSVGSRQVLINARKKITKMMILVSVIYALCCLPTLLFYYVQIYHPKMFSSNVFYPASYLFMLLNYSINPFIYSFQSREFRRCCKRIFCKKSRQAQVSHESVSISTLRLRTGRLSRIEFDTRL